MATKALAAFLASTSSTAWTAPPAARKRRLETARRHRGVGVEMHDALLRRGVAELLDVIHRMAQRDGLERRRRRLDARERLKFFRLERALDRAQPIGPLRMAGGVRCSRQAGWVISSVAIGQM